METYIVEFNPEEQKGVFAVSLVNQPAIEEVGVYLSKEEEVLQLKEIEKGLLMSPVLIPDKKILRLSEDGTPFNIVFPKETIELAQRHFHINGYQSQSTEEHDYNLKLSDVTIVESWIKEFEQDKSNAYGYDLPIGTWFAIMKIDNEEIKTKIKSGEIKGFSIDGAFKLNNYKMTKENKFMNALKELFSIEKVELSEVETTPTAEIVKLAVDAPDGKYVGEDGTTLVLVGGEITEVMQPEAPAEQSKEAEPMQMAGIKEMIIGMKNDILKSVGKVIEDNNVTLKSEFLKATEIALTAETKQNPEAKVIKEPKNFKERMFNELQNAK